MDLRHSLIPDELIDDLLHTMPKHEGPDLEADRNLDKYDYIGYMAKMGGDDGALHVPRRACDVLEREASKLNGGSPSKESLISPQGSPAKKTG